MIFTQIMQEDKKAWNKFRKRITINANPKAIYDSFATQEGLEKWFLRKADFLTSDGRPRRSSEQIQKNDKYYWLWHGHNDDVYEKREILEANERNFLQFEFTDDCKVSIRIKKEDGENILELTQENIEFDKDPSKNQLVACGESWTFYLTNLKSVLEGGIDLRNKNAALKKLINS